MDKSRKGQTGSIFWWREDQKHHNVLQHVRLEFVQVFVSSFRKTDPKHKPALLGY